MDSAPVANCLGLLALMFYIATLLPTTLKIVFPGTKKTRFLKFLFKYRRQIGIVTFFFTVAHARLLIIKRYFDFFNLQTYLISYTGVASFIIFALLTITSNNWSIKIMKKNWKKLHQMTYLAMFLLLWHVIDKMQGHWSYITPLAMLGITSITILFIIRKILEWRKKWAKTKSKNETTIA